MATVKRSNPNAFKILAKNLESLSTKEVKAGWFASAVYEGGTPVAYVATIQEYGWGPIPPRPFMRPTIVKREKTWRDFMLVGSRAVLAGKETVDVVMDKFGALAAGDVAKTITEIWSPPLSPITLELRARRRRGDIITGKTVGEAARAVAAEGYQTPDVSKKPLVDEAIMLNALTHVVEDAK